MNEPTRKTVDLMLENVSAMEGWFEAGDMELGELLFGSKHGKLSNSELGGELIGWLEEHDYELYEQRMDINTTEVGAAVREALK